MNQRKVQLPGEAGCLGKLELTCFPGGTSGKEPTCQCRRHETWVRSLGQEDPLEKEMATHSSILAWRILWTEEPGRSQSMGSRRVRHNRETNTHTKTEFFLFWVDPKALSPPKAVAGPSASYNLYPPPSQSFQYTLSPTVLSGRQSTWINLLGPVQCLAQGRPSTEVYCSFSTGEGPKVCYSQRPC